MSITFFSSFSLLFSSGDSDDDDDSEEDVEEAKLLLVLNLLKLLLLKLLLLLKKCRAIKRFAERAADILFIMRKMIYIEGGKRSLFYTQNLFTLL